MDVDLMAVALKAMMDGSKQKSDAVDEGDSVNAFTAKIILKTDGIYSVANMSKGLRELLGKEGDEWFKKTKKLISPTIEVSTHELYELLEKYGDGGEILKLIKEGYRHE